MPYGTSVFEPICMVKIIGYPHPLIGYPRGMEFQNHWVPTPSDWVPTRYEISKSLGTHTPWLGTPKSNDWVPLWVPTLGTGTHWVPTIWVPLGYAKKKTMQYYRHLQKRVWKNRFLADAFDAVKIDCDVVKYFPARFWKAWSLYFRVPKNIGRKNSSRRTTRHLRTPTVSM